MPVESGPHAVHGVCNYRLPSFQTWATGCLFFNPALFHAAGHNTTNLRIYNIQRSANLLQISSAFGKPMESIDTLELALVGNVGEGYPFPTNLDRRVPETAGMAPDSEQDGEISVLLQAMYDDSRAG
ncbi:hypothetical protein K504DRAFT_474314 [Pleomassaria siparia CBS 279.74]|uniref:Uncharacterized protein n=1 Tax=Pleomassaria siparia CBS 279.74 TaxID=1314801 RepID=A0A6G1JR53_9PLEO|nr:hypothetical protein K504DRAFT_474314 [Pleomassaria siparia CBS 279.74]